MSVCKQVASGNTRNGFVEYYQHTICYYALTSLFNLQLFIIRSWNWLIRIRIIINIWSLLLAQASSCVLLLVLLTLSLINMLRFSVCKK
jgi:hypothetical protein